MGRVIAPARDRLYVERGVDIENLEYIEDPRICGGRIAGDVIMLRTAGRENRVLEEGEDGYPQPSPRYSPAARTTDDSGVGSSAHAKR